MNNPFFNFVNKLTESQQTNKKKQWNQTTIYGRRRQI